MKTSFLFLRNWEQNQNLQIHKKMIKVFDKKKTEIFFLVCISVIARRKITRALYHYAQKLQTMETQPTTNQFMHLFRSTRSSCSVLVYTSLLKKNSSMDYNTDSQAVTRETSI